jgi:hypothetical protein
MKQKDELEVYRNLLINLHTARWTMNNDRVIKILDLIGNYSYARTNSNGDEEQDRKNQERTLLALKGV